MTDRHTTLHEQLRERICLLDYPPGTRLSESELAQEFGTSRTPLRRVLAKLEEEGLVQSRHGVGTIVTDLNPAEMLQTYALREHLAALAAQLSPVTITRDHRVTMQTLLSRCLTLRTAPDARTFAQLNMEFFDFGLSLTNNEALRETSERLYYRTARIWLHRVPFLDLADEIEIFLSELSETARAINLGDTRAAALIRCSHISMCAARILNR